MPDSWAKPHLVGLLPSLRYGQALFCRSGCLDTRDVAKTLRVLDRVDSTFCHCKADRFQNLIPLVIRPLRLVLPSERLRSARIVLLKATHLPLVVAIWAYEQLVNARKHSPGVMSYSGPQTPTSKKPPRLPVNSPRLLMADAPNPLGRVHHASRSHPRAGLTEPDAQLKTLVLKLSTQVEELTAMVSQLHEQREASTSAA
jgi:hypothetical protein